MIKTPICDLLGIEYPIFQGGIADGRGIAAAFMLGACGVQVGTRFLVAEECSVHPVYKEKILKASDIATITTGKRLGHPVRSLKTPFSRDYAKAEFSAISDEDLAGRATGAARRKEGDVDHGCFLAGQVAGMIHREQPAAEIIREMFAQAEPILKGACQWVE